MKKDSSTNNGNNYVVAVGASAGGMEALHDLFDYMPTSTGFSFVVIQHLSPDHKSLMAELLAKHTQMQVLEAENGMEVEPNFIYAIPSKKIMTIHSGRLHLNEKLKSSLPNNAVDVFFESLAEDKGKNAVGIILSGTGTDGTKGIDHIKKKGGIVIVQEPMSAAFDGMPNSAVNTGAADLILPPEMMGEELLEFIKDSPMVRSLNKLSDEDDTKLHQIIKTLHQFTRLDFSNYKRPTLLRRLAKRMSEIGINDLSEYNNFLEAHEDEMVALAKEFLINVTKFFRDTEAFEALKTEAIPSILANRKAEEPIKVWVAACSSGEEAYSLTMLFLEHIEKARLTSVNLKIFATDIDSEALETASRGIYNESITRDVPQHFLQKYFLREGNMYRVSQELRKYVVFANHDILKDPPFSHLHLITCRNMFIYVNAALQQKMLRKFHFALKVDAYLMLGPSENIGILKNSMHEINRKWKLYRCVNKAGLMDQGSLIGPIDQGQIYPRPAKQASNTRNAMNQLAEIFKDTLMEARPMAMIFIDRDFNVKQAIGAYKNFMKFPESSFNFNLMKLVSNDMSIALGVGVRKAIMQDQPISMKNIVLHEETKARSISMFIKPYLKQNEFQQAFLCIIMEEDEPKPISKKTLVLNDGNLGNLERMNELEDELQSTRQNLQAIIEELETANEELQSNNEEMISTNEELQSTNEELQSLNEELHTVSAEHQLRVKELLELNDDLNNYFNNSDIGQILVDRNLIIRKFTPVVTSMVNVIEADIGRSIMDITTNFKGLDFVKGIRQVISETRPFEKEIAADEKFYYMRIVPFIRRDKVSDGVVINFTDITHAKQLTNIISGVFNSSKNAITAKRAVRDAQNRIIDFEYLASNKAAHKAFGVTEGTLDGKTMLGVFPTKAKDYLHVYAKVVETGNSSAFDFYNKVNDKWYNVSVVKMLDGVVTTHTDITEKRKAADVIARSFEDLKTTTSQLKDSNTQLERSNFDLIQFASVASHDLKEPLRKIQAFGNILKEKINERLSDEERNYFNKIISSSDRMQILIEDVLSLSKLSNNVLIKEEVDLTKVIHGIVDDLEISIKEKSAAIHIGGLPRLYAVNGQMRQLFQNLISNALKFRDKEKTSQITIQQVPVSEKHVRELNIAAPEDFVCISVRDNGIGFEEEYREKIFGIFQRLHGRNFEGTGIGLAISRKIVEIHGGFITAEGELTKGAEFFVFLPGKIG